MNDLRKAAEMALEFVSWFASDDHSIRPKYKAPEITKALRQALAQPDEVLAEREACAQACEDLIGTRAMARHCADAIRARGEWVKTYCGGKPNYTTPEEREWVGLTDHELQVLDFNDPDRGKLARAVEAKLKERNT